LLQHGAAVAKHLGHAAGRFANVAREWRALPISLDNAAKQMMKVIRETSG